MNARLVMLMLGFAVACPTRAGAEPASGYAELGPTLRLSAMATPLLGGSAGVYLGGGYRASERWWIHGYLAGSTIADLEDSGIGSITELRGGIEYHACSNNGLVCVLPGLDLGAAHGDWRNYDSMTRATGTVVDGFTVSRVAVDVGGVIRLRSSVELDLGAGRQSTSDGKRTEFILGLAFGIGIVVQL